MSALSIGLLMELAAVKYHQGQGEAVEDPAVPGGAYGELADWEARHYHALLRRQEALKKDYRQAAGFSLLYQRRLLGPLGVLELAPFRETKLDQLRKTLHDGTG